jgi:hypothetical protein
MAIHAARRLEGKRIPTAFDTAIEGLCGNHIGQAFDLDKFHQVTKSIETKMMSIP